MERKIAPGKLLAELYNKNIHSLNLNSTVFFLNSLECGYITVFLNCISTMLLKSFHISGKEISP